MHIDEAKQIATQLHALGPMPLAYFLADLAKGHDLHEALRRYLELDPDVVRALGADDIEATATAMIAELAYLPPDGSA